MSRSCDLSESESSLFHLEIYPPWWTFFDHQNQAFLTNDFFDAGNWFEKESPQSK